MLKEIPKVGEFVEVLKDGVWDDTNQRYQTKGDIHQIAGVSPLSGAAYFIGDTGREIYIDEAAFEESLTKALQQLDSEFAGLSFTKNQSGLYKINIDPSLVTNHEQHFSQVTEKYLSFLKEGKLPDWEVPNMLAKYYTTTKALELAKSAQ